MISLALGDPTVYGNFTIADECVDAVTRALHSHKADGYAPSHGFESARNAVATKYSSEEAPLTSKDVLLTSGASHALEICINTLCDEGSNILIPRPGFSLYRTLAEAKKIECRYYDLLPSKSWEVDLKHLESLIDENTATVVLNNPSNPCGSVYSEAHLHDILALCEKHRLVVISDEIYADMAFTGSNFTRLARLTRTVPVLEVGGLAKRYLVPGWRLGWVLIHDRNDVLKEVRDGLQRMTTLILGPNSVIQASLQDILHHTPSTFYDQTMKALEHNAKLSLDIVSKIPGLTPVQPQGAMYMMIGINVEQFKDIKSDLDFVEKLVSEESVLCLPGQCFRYPNFVRIVFTAPPEKLQEAFERIAQFCQRHHA